MPVYFTYKTGKKEQKKKTVKYGSSWNDTPILNMLAGGNIGNKTLDFLK